MYQDNFLKPLIIDNFAGGGGASTGIELALGRPVDIAINHDADAIAMHKVNHPYTMHFQEDVFAIEPEKVTGGREVALGWFSPDCRHFSKAKGDKPVEKKIRGLSWVVIKWAMSESRPKVIFLENVEEIQTWGPTIVVDGKEIPDKKREGETFKGFISILSDGITPTHPAFLECCEFLKIKPESEEGVKLSKGLGYKVKFKVLKACDYGAPTIRKRFYMVARCDGKPIVFPEATHGVGKGLKPYRTAADCIDWSIPCLSIFERKKPLVENTLKRIARGLDKFVVKNPRPYIMEMNFDNPPQDPLKPMSTQTSANHHYLIMPNIVQANFENPAQDVQKPLTTQTTVNKHFVVEPYLSTVGYGENKGQAPRVRKISEPLTTVVSTSKQGLSIPLLSKYFSGEGQKGANIEDPMPTVTSIDHNALIATNLMHYYGGSDHASKTDKPLPTVTTLPRHYLTESHLCIMRNHMDCKPVSDPIPTMTKISHEAQVITRLEKVQVCNNLGNWPKVRELLNKYAGYNIADDEILIFEINKVKYFISDVGMRMLKAEELKVGQGFPKDYVIDIESKIGKKYSEAKQIMKANHIDEMSAWEKLLSDLKAERNKKLEGDE